jgi:hypothetical protein
LYPYRLGYALSTAWLLRAAVFHARPHLRTIRGGPILWLQATGLISYSYPAHERIDTGKKRITQEIVERQMRHFQRTRKKQAQGIAEGLGVRLP